MYVNDRFLDIWLNWHSWYKLKIMHLTEVWKTAEHVNSMVFTTTYAQHNHTNYGEELHNTNMSISKSSKKNCSCCACAYNICSCQERTCCCKHNHTPSAILFSVPYQGGNEPKIRQLSILCMCACLCLCCGCPDHCNYAYASLYLCRSETKLYSSTGSSSSAKFPTCWHQAVNFSSGGDNKKRISYS